MRRASVCLQAILMGRFSTRARCAMNEKEVSVRAEELPVLALREWVQCSYTLGSGGEHPPFGFFGPSCCVVRCRSRSLCAQGLAYSYVGKWEKSYRRQNGIREEEEETVYV